MDTIAPDAASVRPGDLIAGRRITMSIGFAPQEPPSAVGYYCGEPSLWRAMMLDSGCSKRVADTY